MLLGVTRACGDAAEPYQARSNELRESVSQGIERTLESPSPWLHHWKGAPHSGQ